MTHAAQPSKAKTNGVQDIRSKFFGSKPEEQSSYSRKRWRPAQACDGYDRLCLVNNGKLKNTGDCQCFPMHFPRELGILSFHQVPRLAVSAERA